MEKKSSSSNRFSCIWNVRLHKRQDALVWWTMYMQNIMWFSTSNSLHTCCMLHTIRMPSLACVDCWHTLHAMIRTIVTIALSVQQTPIKHLSQHNRFKFIKQWPQTQHLTRACYTVCTVPYHMHIQDTRFRGKRSDRNIEIHLSLSEL